MTTFARIALLAVLSVPLAACAAEAGVSAGQHTTPESAGAPPPASSTQQGTTPTPPPQQAPQKAPSGTR
ncbi:MAG TPA: hypothetical protein VHB21_24505 [Minicystis sp.]|nr:hypothetical protein [Minicystis sp.]